MRSEPGAARGRPAGAKLVDLCCIGSHAHADDRTFANWRF